MNETIAAVRERERERELYSKEIGFIFDVKNKLNRYKKRIDYMAKVEKEKIKLLHDSLSFL